MEISVTDDNILNTYSPDTVYSLFAKAGFTGVDFSFAYNSWTRQCIYDCIEPERCVYDGSVDEITESVRSRVDAIRKNGLKITQAHAPFPAYIDGNESFTFRCAEMYKKIIKVCDTLGCRHLVIHPLFRRNKLSVSDAYLYDLNIKMYSELIPVLKECDVTVCLENLFGRNNGVIYASPSEHPNEMIKMLDYLNEKAGKRCFAFCLDVGHLHATKTDMYTFIHKMAGYIDAIHIHDNCREDDSHRVPFIGGTVCWEYFCRYLNEIGYGGNINFEVYFNSAPFELLLPFYTVTAECGKYFANEIGGEK